MIVRNNLEGFGVFPHENCFARSQIFSFSIDLATDSAHKLVLSRIFFKENRLKGFSRIDRSNGIDSSFVESINQGNGRKVPINCNDVPLLSQRTAQIQDHVFGARSSLSFVVFTRSHALVDFEAVRVPFTVTPFKDLEAFPDRFVCHRLPYRRAALELDHALVDALFSGCLSTIFKTKIEVGENPSDPTERIRLSLCSFEMLSSSGDVIATCFEKRH
jgi:hypothetical protein